MGITPCGYIPFVYTIGVQVTITSMQNNFLDDRDQIASQEEYDESIDDQWKEEMDDMMITQEDDVY